MGSACKCCGGCFDDEKFMEHMVNKSDVSNMCSDCIDLIKSNSHIQSAFATIRENLSEQNQDEWESGSFDEKMFFFLDMHERGYISMADTKGDSADFGSMATYELVKAYLARYEFLNDM
jgi:hypothetical protein